MCFNLDFSSKYYFSVFFLPRIFTYFTFYFFPGDNINQLKGMERKNVNCKSIDKSESYLEMT